jgi:hypothetical protein
MVVLVAGIIGVDVVKITVGALVVEVSGAVVGVWMTTVPGSPGAAGGK